MGDPMANLAQTFIEALEMRCCQAEGSADAPPLSFDEAYTLIGLAKRRLVTDERYLDPDEACWFLGIKKSRLYYLTHVGKIPYRKIGRSLRFLKSELVAFMEGEEHEPEEKRAAN